jgi:hypothetical protein
VAREHEHTRPVAPQRAELDRGPLVVEHRHLGEVVCACSHASIVT